MIHAVWGTKKRVRIINQESSKILLDHIREYAKKKEIYIDVINSQPDHIHCLFGLNADMALSKAMNLIKGESSHWINKEKLFKTKFEWADEYFAASVSESQLPKVRAYIRNQEEHHRRAVFQEEFEKFIRSYGYKSMADQ
jgi:putative transposase